MVVKVIETGTSILERAEAPKLLSAAEVADFINESKPGGKPKQDAIDSLAEHFEKSIVPLKGTEEYQRTKKPDDEFADITGATEVVFGSKAKKAYEEAIASLSAELKGRADGNKSGAMVYRQPKVLEDLLALIAIKTDDDEFLKPTQNKVRDLLKVAIQSFYSGSTNNPMAEYESMVLGILDADPSTSLRNVVDLINSQGIEKLSKLNSGFIGKISRSYGSLGKTLAEHVYNKVHSLLQRPLDSLSDDLDPGVKAKITDLKDTTFEKIFDEITEKHGKTIEKAVRAGNTLDADFINNYRNKLKALFKAESPEDAMELAHDLNNFLNSYAMRGPKAEAETAKLKQLKTALKTAVNRADRPNPNPVLVDVKTLGDDAVLRKSCYDDIVKQSESVIASTGAKIYEFSQTEIVAILNKAKPTDAGQNTIPLLGGDFSGLTKEAFDAVIAAVKPDGTADTGSWAKATVPTTGARVAATTAAQTTTTARANAATAAQATATAQAAATAAVGQANQPAADAALLQAQQDQQAANAALLKAEADQKAADAAVVTAAGGAAGAAAPVANPGVIVQAIIDKLTQQAKDKDIKELETAQKIVTISKDTGTNYDQKIKAVLGSNPLVKGETPLVSTWTLTIDSSNKATGTSLEKLLEERIAVLQKEAKADVKFINTMAKTVIGPILTKARTINATTAKYMMDSAIDKDSQLNEEYKDSFKEQAEAARDLIIAAQTEAANNLTTAKLASAQAADTALTGSLSKLGLANYNAFITNLGLGANSSQSITSFNKALNDGHATKLGISLTDDERQCLEVSSNSGSSPFDLAKVNLQRVLVISRTLLALKLKQDKGATLDPALATLLNSTQPLLNKLNDGVVTGIKSTWNNFHTHHVRKIADLDTENEKIQKISTDDVWSLYDEQDVPAKVQDILGKLKDSVATGLEMTMRFLGLKKVEGATEFQKRVAAIPGEGNDSGFLDALKTALMQLNSSMSTTATESKASQSASPTA